MISMLLLLLGTIIGGLYLYLYLKVNDEVLLKIVKQKHYVNTKTIISNEKKINKYNQTSNSINIKIVKSVYNTFFDVKSLEKKNANLTKEILSIKNGENYSINIISGAGYVLLDLLKINADNKLYKSIYKYYSQLEGKHNAKNNTEHFMAFYVSVIMYGLTICLGIGCILFVTGDITKGLIVSFAVPILILFFCYMQYDDLRDKTNKQQEKIIKDLPNAVSKLALLTNSGMEMMSAWKYTAYSSENLLYQEMRFTQKELELGINIVVALENFINRCSTQETSKLATLIMQNITKGNSEIANMLKNMSDEVWNEKKHNAKRAGEKAQSKLVIPTMLMFIGILLLVMVPMFTSMNVGF